jgi:hypothetical protein
MKGHCGSGNGLATGMTMALPRQAGQPVVPVGTHCLLPMYGDIDLASCNVNSSCMLIMMV